MSDGRYQVDRKRLKRGGFGNYHIIDIRPRQALCKLRGRWTVNPPWAKPIDVVLTQVEASYYAKGKGMCKHCLREAEKLRGVLDRLADL